MVDLFLLPQASDRTDSQTIVLPHISWHTYQALLIVMGHRVCRLAYDRGMLEIIMPSDLHEFIKHLLDAEGNHLGCDQNPNSSAVSAGSVTFGCRSSSLVAAGKLPGFG